jgi:energy-coupling factor transport system permease protein
MTAACCKAAVFIAERAIKFHPATQIIAWCILVATLQKLSLVPLLTAAAFILLVAFALSGHKFFQLLRRTRWVMISLLLIYFYSTPGEPLSEAMGVLSPSREGLMDGVLQLTRLLSALAALAVLLDRLGRAQLIAGLYTVFAPAQWLGLSRERLAVRLALTLHYAEAAMLRHTNTWQDSLRGLFEPHNESAEPIELPISRFSLGDALLVVSMLAILGLAW